MQEVFEKILEKLENIKKREYLKEDNTDEDGMYCDCEDAFDDGMSQGKYEMCFEMINFINQIKEEYNNGWIPVSERLPEEHDSMFAKLKGTDKWNDAMFEKTSDIVNVTVEDMNGNAATTVAHTVDGKWKCDLLVINSSYRITAWQPLPEPYQPKGDKE